MMIQKKRTRWHFTTDGFFFILRGVFRHEVMVKWAEYIIFVMIWIKTIANTGSASSTICGM